MESNYFPPTEKEAKEMGVASSERRNAGFPSRLRQLRNKKGESQATLAKELMVTKSTISLYETGDNVPDARTIRKMAEHFEVSADYLLGLSESETNDKDVQFVSDYTGLAPNVVSRLHILDDRSGIVKEWIGRLFKIPDNASEDDISKTIDYLVQSAMAQNRWENMVNARQSTFNKTGRFPDDDRVDVGSLSGLYCDRAGRYWVEDNLAAELLIGEAIDTLQILTDFILHGLRDDLSKQIEGMSEAEVERRYMRPYSDFAIVPKGVDVEENHAE